MVVLSDVSTIHLSDVAAAPTVPFTKEKPDLFPCSPLPWLQSQLVCWLEHWDGDMLALRDLAVCRL